MSAGMIGYAWQAWEMSVSGACQAILSEGYQNNAVGKQK